MTLGFFWGSGPAGLRRRRTVDYLRPPLNCSVQAAPRASRRGLLRDLLNCAAPAQWRCHCYFYGNRVAFVLAGWPDRAACHYVKVSLGLRAPGLRWRCPANCAPPPLTAWPSPPPASRRRLPQRWWPPLLRRLRAGCATAPPELLIGFVFRLRPGLPARASGLICFLFAVASYCVTVAITKHRYCANCYKTAVTYKMNNNLLNILFLLTKARITKLKTTRCCRKQKPDENKSFFADLITISYSSVP